jgi:short-subunit dehydrogenase
MSAAAPTHALITGGGGGIGKALAVAFSKQGARVGLCGRDLDKLRIAADACPGPVSVRRCDVTQAADMEDWLLSCDAEAPVDCVVACAGIGGAETLAGPLSEGGETARRIFAVNAQGVVNTVTPLLPRMAARRSGRVVVISSLAGLIALPDSPAYSASKAAVIVYGESLRRLLRDQGISVTVVCPGFVDTDMVRSLGMRPPFLWTAERAAAVILDGIIREKAMVAFPWQLRAALLASRILPRPAVDRILSRLRARAFQQ